MNLPTDETECPLSEEASRFFRLQSTKYFYALSTTAGGMRGGSPRRICPRAIVFSPRIGASDAGGR